MLDVFVGSTPVILNTEKETEEVEEESDSVKELLSAHTVWLRMWKNILE